MTENRESRIENRERARARARRGIDRHVASPVRVTYLVSPLGSGQLPKIGVLGESIGRIEEEVKRRPLYVVKEKVNVEPDDE